MDETSQGPTPEPISEPVADPQPAEIPGSPMDSGTQTAEDTPPRDLSPVQTQERIEILDVLRGVAIMGILLINMGFFFAPMSLQILGEPLFRDDLSRIVQDGINLFAQGKFYSLFSFLFGVGLAIQLERAQARGRQIAPFFARRMGWLLVIGLTHGLLIWFGDILALYSLMGLLLLAFHSRAFKTLKIWSAVFFALPILLAMAQVAMVMIMRQSPATAEMVQMQAEGQKEWFTALASDALQTYPDGSWLEIAVIRLNEWLLATPMALFFIGWVVLAIFLIGLYAGRKRFFHNLPQNIPAARRWFWPLLVLGLAANFALVWTTHRIDMAHIDLLFLANQILFVLAPPTLTAAYVLGACILWQRPGVRRLMLLVAPVGRMALTNYLTHSVVFTFISYGYGLGRYGTVSPLMGLLMTLAIFVVQIVISTWWLKRFRFGPAEWMWRSLTYGKAQPMRRQAA